jgi:ankyrin repeat protein
METAIQVLLATERWLRRNYSQEFPKQMTRLHLAAYSGIKAVVKLLLEKGADVTAVNQDGWTPLYWVGF